MRKGLFLFLWFFMFSSFSTADYEKESIERFINSPSYIDLEFILDEKIRFCEEAFLDAYRRREFTEKENKICSDFFARKIEDELNYKKSVLSERWIY